MLEREIELHFVARMRKYGFKVLKMTTPGTAGIMDRLIMFPSYAPAPPEFVEFKKPGGKLTLIQQYLHKEYRQRGLTIHPHVSSMEEADALADTLIDRVVKASGGKLK